MPLWPLRGLTGIATVRAGDELAGVFACTRKDRLLTRSGTPYLALELRDRTGTLPARVFRDADVLAGRFDRGDLVRVAGRVERFRDELQAELRAIAARRPGEADPAAFLPVAFRDLDELDGFLEHLAGEVRHPAFRALLGDVLGDAALRAALRGTPCTRGGHHAYLGGLLEHTVAVATLAVELVRPAPPARPGPAADRRRRPRPRPRPGLQAGAPRSRSARRGGCSATSSSGCGCSRSAPPRTGLDDPRHLALAHCVLTHHGADAAPGRRFASAEAVALHRLNALDASVKDAVEHGLD